MAKRHKHADNGIALDTALSIADLRSICAQAAAESTGDLWNGTQNIVEGDSGETWILYVIQGSLTGWNKFMTFTVSFGGDNGRSTLRTEIDTYSTSQTTLMYFIPVSPKKMRARHTYLQFVNKVANTVRLADQSARIVLNEGEWQPAAVLPPSVGTSPVPIDAPAPLPIAQSLPVTPQVLEAAPVTHSTNIQGDGNRTGTIPRTPMKSAGLAVFILGAVLGAIMVLWVAAGVRVSAVPVVVVLGGAGVALMALGAKMNKDKAPNKPVQWQPAPTNLVAASSHNSTLSLALVASNPATPLEELADLAHKHAELRPIIAANPSTYPALVEWLAALGDPAIATAIQHRNGLDAKAVQASDPATPPEALADLAYGYPHLRGTIAANPASYPALRDWISAVGDTAPAPVVSGASLAVAGAASAGGGLSVPVAVLGGVWTAQTIALATVIALVSGVSVWAGTGTANAIATAVSQGLYFAQGGPGAGGSSTGTGSGSGSSGTNNGLSAPQSGSGGSANTPQTVTPVAQYIPTVLILDASGSMVRSVPSGGTRMDAARAAAATFVNGLGSDARVGLTVFGTSTGNQDSEQAAGCSDVKRVIPVGPVDKPTFTAAIAGIVQSGFTPLGPALLNAAAQLSRADSALIVLVSDGVDTCSPPPACDVAASVRAQHPGITIHAIGFAVDADEQAQEQLKCIARVGGGEYVGVGDAAQLAARLRALSDPVSTAGAVNARGIGPLQLGMSLAQAKAADATVVPGRTVLGVQYAESDRGTLQFKGGQLYAIQPGKSVPTAEGVRVGDPLTLATAIYGTGTSAQDADGTYFTVATAPGSVSGYRFYGGSDGKVAKIVVCLCGPGLLPKE